MEAPGQPAPEVRVVAIIGAGRLGRRFALLCAGAGFDVVLEDVMPVNLRRAADEYQEMTAGLVSTGTLSVALTVEQAVERADIAVDFVPDELESKLEIFSLMDRMAPPRTIFCTPSDALSITDLASCVYRPERCFAVRGDLFGGEMVRLLYPEAASVAAQDALKIFFQKIGAKAELEPDPDAPVLMKNIAGR
jgi:3-hydroxybutyryl-CoA dehydrogenase